MKQEHRSLTEISVLQRISDAIFSINQDCEITFMNKAAEELFHLRTEDCIGAKLAELLHGVIGGDFNEKLQQSFDKQTDIHFEINMTAFQSRWLSVHLYPAADGITILLRDISVNKKVEAAIEDKHKKLALLSEASSHLFSKNEPEEIFDSLFKELAEYLDLDVYFNYMYDKKTNKLHLMNYAGISDAVAKEIEWLKMGEAVCGCVAKDRMRIIAENIDTSDDVRVQLIKGLGIKAYACHPLMSYGKLIGTLSFGSSTRSNFTEEEIDLIHTICNQLSATLDRICLISELRRKKEEAEKAYAAKSEFLSMMSHELRTPMNSILGFAQILQEDQSEPLTLKQKSRVEKILKSSHHLLKLINDLLEIGKMGSGAHNIIFEHVQICSVVTDSLKIIRPIAADKGITIHNKLGPNAGMYVKADPVRLVQILLNLLSNAVKYTHKNGRVVLTCERVQSHLKVIISDNGIGIPLEEQKKVFDPFYRIFDKELNIEGTGIGLTLVKQFLEQMHGTVGLESTPGQGSSFWFTLPMVIDNMES